MALYSQYSFPSYVNMQICVTVMNVRIRVYGLTAELRVVGDDPAIQRR
jgi:hypothetical protein